MNHKTNEFFPEGTGLLNLSMSTSIYKRTMICIYFGVIHSTIEKIIIGKRPTSTRRPRDVPCRFLKGPKGTFRGLSRNQYKIDDLMKKFFFRSNSACITYLFLFFTERKNMQKF